MRAFHKHAPGCSVGAAAGTAVGGPCLHWHAAPCLWHCSKARLAVTARNTSSGSDTSPFYSSNGRPHPGSVGFEQTAGAPESNGTGVHHTTPPQEQRRNGSQLARTMQQLQALGLAGVVAYGLLNTLYYTCTFTFVWFVVAKVPSGQGTAAAAKAFLTVFASVWAGSQLTKVARAAGALLLAPIIDKSLDGMQSQLRLRNKQQAFVMILVICLSMAWLLFAGVILAWS